LAFASRPLHRLVISKNAWRPIFPSSWLIQTFGNLLEQSPLPPIHTAQEFSQFVVARPPGSFGPSSLATGTACWAAGDTGPADAALREAEEEIALARSVVEPICYLDIHITPFGHRIGARAARF
jgi:hypothetical protein